MTTWKEAAAQLGTSSLVDSLKALEGTMKKRDYKRLVSTTAAQLLELHPGVGAKKARRWVRRATGTKPAKRGVQQAEPTGADESGDLGRPAADDAAAEAGTSPVRDAAASV
ncbi:MAG TPA: hypothetical protein VEB59_04560 [Gemmatimonadales bacterium]|nr:hypothetical protein [Gemmatimonadales bacterium]